MIMFSITNVSPMLCTHKEKGHHAVVRQQPQTLSPIYGRPFSETQRHGEPSPTLETLSEHLFVACRAPPKFCNYPTLSIRQYIAVFLGNSMPTLDSWLRHLANPLRRIFQLQKRGFYIAQCLIRVNFKKNLSKKKSNKQLLCTKTTYKYGVWSAIFVLV